MFQPSLKAHARLGALLVVAAFATFFVAPSGADAYSVTCSAEDTSCLADTGFTGEPLWGYPVDSTGNNCTTYAAFRLMRNGLVDPGSYGDATFWAENAVAQGFTVDQTPAVGSIAQWTKDGRFAPEFGHVAYVERVTPNRIFLSDSNWHGGSKRWTVSRRDWQWPGSFIHFKDVTADSVSVEPTKTQVKTLAAARDLGHLRLELKCTGGGPSCFAVVGGWVDLRRRGRSGVRLGLGSRVIELKPGAARQVTVELPRGVRKSATVAKRTLLYLRVDTLGVRTPTVIRRRLE